MKKTVLLIAALMFIQGAHAQEQRTEDWGRTDRYAEQNALVKASGIRPKAVFMGDSITDNWGNRTHPEFFSEHNFAGRGISGQTSCQMLVRMRPDVIDLHPKYVVILSGTNDVAQNIGPVDMDVVLGNIISMCELARANKIKPVICSVLPADRFGWRPELKTPGETIKALNASLKAYAEKEHIPYVDFHSALDNGKGGLPEKYAKDGVHPNLECYGIMESMVLPYLK